VIAQMLGWNWDSVAAECTNFLGPADRLWLRSRRAFEAYPRPGTQWWTDY
ncbi:hypothetical protein EDB84DRAFT_1281645, partial [Lactarius hengduanensis]